MPTTTAPADTQPHAATGTYAVEPQPCRNVPRLAPTATAASALALLEHTHFECIDDLAVCEGRRLVGLVPLEEVLTAAHHAPLGDLMDVDPPVITAGEDLEPAIGKAVRHGESSVAVVDRDANFVGLIPPRRLLGVLLSEHDEDIARIGGYLASTTSARTAAEEPVVRRLLHRLPWLLVGLAGAFVAAGIVSGFEHELSADVTVAFFVPGIVYLADAVGTQTEALVIRGLSVGVPIRRVVRRELLTGLFVGLLLALAFVPFGLLLWDDRDVIMATAVALFAACASATVVAMTLPGLLHRLGRDPAFGSGPVATVIQDLTSLVIYFAVVTTVVS